MANPNSRGGARWRLAARLGVGALVLGSVAWMLRALDLGALGAALAHAHGWPIALAALLNFGLITCKAIAWRVLLAPRHAVPLHRLVSYTITSCAASVLAPLRAGELIRLWLLRDRDGVPIATGAAVAVAEKLLDVVSMVLLVAPLPWLLPEAPAMLRAWLAGLLLVAIAAPVLIQVIARRLRADGWASRFAQALTILHRPRTVALVLAALLTSWLIDLAMVALVLAAVGIALPLPAAGLVLFAINLTVAIPSTPGQVGALELGALVGLHLLGVPDAASLAFAVTYHALQVIPVVAVGLALHAKDVLRPRDRA